MPYVVGFLGLLFVRRDLTVAYVSVAGVVTGIIAALISAPISANVFGGVTGGGTDFLVAAFRQAGADMQTATFRQGSVGPGRQARDLLRGLPHPRRHGAPHQGALPAG